MRPEEEVRHLHDIIDLIEEAFMVYRGQALRDRIAVLVRASRPPVRYKLVFDAEFGCNVETCAYTRMARYGTWDGDWWIPNPSQLAEKRIEREGYIVVEAQE